MNSKMKIRMQSSNAVKPVVYGAGISMVITILLSMFVALLIQGERISEGSMGYAVMIMLLLASYIGSFSACKMSTQRLTTSIITGGIYMGCLLVTGILFYDGTLQAVGETMLLILCGSVLAAMWTSRENRHKKFKKFKIPNR